MRAALVCRGDVNRIKRTACMVLHAVVIIYGNLKGPFARLTTVRRLEDEFGRVGLKRGVTEGRNGE